MQRKNQTGTIAGFARRQTIIPLCINARDAGADAGRVIIERRKVVFDGTYCADHLGFVEGNRCCRPSATMDATWTRGSSIKFSNRFHL